MDFRFLQARLVAHVHARVRNGEISERSLARLTGVSQPHIHNVLKGKRTLSAEMADQIMERLHIHLPELLGAGELGAKGHPGWSEGGGECRTVALLDGWIGREYTYPIAEGTERYPFLATDVERLELPVAARLAPDPLRSPIFDGRAVILLDRSAKARKAPDEEGYFALDLLGGGTIGLVRRAGQRLYLWHRRGDIWESTRLPDRDLPAVIQGRVSLLVRHL